MKPRTLSLTLAAVFTAGVLTGLRLHDLREHRVHRAVEEDSRHAADNAHWAPIEDITARDPSPRHPARRLRVAGAATSRAARIPQGSGDGGAA